MQKFKCFDWLLLVEFVIACVMVAYAAGDLIVHSRTYPSSSTMQWIITSSDSTEIYCISMQIFLLVLLMICFVGWLANLFE